MNRIYTILILIFSLISVVGSAQYANNCEAQIAYTVDAEISPLTYNFADSSQSVYTIVDWEWTFGNGETSRKQNPNHQYLTAGTYAISLKITDVAGSIDIDYDTIIISDVAPPSCNAYFTYLLDINAANYTCVFTDHSIHSNDSIISWTWDFGDSSPASHLQHPIHQYSSIGTYNVELIINTINGCTSSYSTIIIISSGGVDCNASYTYGIDTTSSNPFSIIFHDNSLYSSPILTWKWQFGDGDSSSFQDPHHQFPYAGIYNVKLKITTSTCESEIEIPVQVGNPQKYNFWGRVYVGNQTTDQCVAYLYKDFNNNCIIPFDTVVLTSVNDSLGVYYFYQIPEGDYKVHVVLPSSSQFFDDYAPTYYNNSVLWNGSQNIALFSDLSLQNIHMKELTLQYGTNYIEGSVQNQANGQLEGVIVFLINSQGEIIDFTYTNAQGEYSFDEVPVGNFYVYGDLTGFASYPAAVNFNTLNDSISNVNFLIKGRSSVGFIGKEILNEKNDFKIYPNPITNNTLKIKFQKVVHSKVNFIIYNSLGIEVKNGVLNKGNSNFQIELDNLTKGLYFINLFHENGKNIEVKKFVY